MSGRSQRWETGGFTVGVSARGSKSPVPPEPWYHEPVVKAVLICTGTWVRITGVPGLVPGCWLHGQDDGGTTGCRGGSGEEDQCVRGQNGRVE